MRLKAEQAQFLKNQLKKCDSVARLYLFGSRTDDLLKGGDIDLLVVSQKLRKVDLWKIRQPFYEQFGEQKIDIVITNQDEKPSAFVRHILTQAVEL